MADRCVRALIRGTVQGVGFRYATRDAAKALGARGYVRNLPGDLVEAVFEADEETVERALAFVAHGPPAARVTGVEAEPIKCRGFSDFDIL